MSPQDLAATMRRLPWSLWWRQMLAIARLEIRKSLFGRRSLPVYLLATAPILMMLIFAVVPARELDEGYNLGQARAIYSTFIYQGFILRAVIFLGCLGIFTNLFRGEVLDRSLHYYFLSPVRREVLVAGKYLSGLSITALLFLGTTLVTYLLSYSHFGLTRLQEDFTTGPGLAHLFAYLGVTLLACIGYGSVFLIAGLLFRNPILPAAGIFGWEFINFLLPPVLKRISVIHYLKGLCPIPISEGPLAIVVEPPPAIVSVTGLLLLTLAVLTLASLRLRRMEIRYGED